MSNIPEGFGSRFVGVLVAGAAWEREGRRLGLRGGVVHRIALVLLSDPLERAQRGTAGDHTARCWSGGQRGSSGWRNAAVPDARRVGRRGGGGRVLSEFYVREEVVGGQDPRRVDRIRCEEGGQDPLVLRGGWTGSVGLVLRGGWTGSVGLVLRGGIGPARRVDWILRGLDPLVWVLEDPSGGLLEVHCEVDPSGWTGSVGLVLRGGWTGSVGLGARGEWTGSVGLVLRVVGLVLRGGCTGSVGVARRAEFQAGSVGVVRRVPEFQVGQDPLARISDSLTRSLRRQE